LHNVCFPKKIIENISIILSKVAANFETDKPYLFFETNHDNQSNSCGVKYDIKIVAPALLAPTKDSKTPSLSENTPLEAAWHIIAYSPLT
jgi:hypothetical protein